MYDHKQIEEKWLAFWEEKSLFQDTAHLTTTPTKKAVTSRGKEAFSELEKIYLLIAFAYPSGAGLHVGHVESKTAMDILARYYRMNGKQVFFPVGWDAFGLPAENYAIKTGIPPAVTTKNSIDTFRRQIKRVGISYDWANELATSHPGYYRWTQWLFVQLFKKGLAYQGTGMVNWCPSCQTVLANEQVVDGSCERCGAEVTQKNMKQWFFKITQYRDELISGLDQVDWPAATKQQQLNWIGKSEGVSIDFQVAETDAALTVWTKFWETVFGATFVVIAPEKFIELELLQFVSSERQDSVVAYIETAKGKTEEERKIGEKDKTGVDTGLLVTNPVNGEKVPLFIADYVLMGVGTAVVMGVPAHDERDFTFAKKFSLPIRQVVAYEDSTINAKVAAGAMAFEGEGTLVNSGTFDGQDAWGEGKTALAEWMIEKGIARRQTTYKLRDWLISRQRYWGAPIPVIYDPAGEAHVVDDKRLPWLLPTDVDFKPTGESPLASSKEFQSRTEQYAAEHCAELIKKNGWDVTGKGWRPEYDTMDTFVDSSWYYLRYVSARNEEVFADPAQLADWLPVDFYMIGPEHIVLHLLYSRFFTKFLRDEGYLQFGEPFMKMRHQGMILGPDNKKMSKSKGNVINPDQVIEKFGADCLRMYEMFMGPIESEKPWNVTAVLGIHRFLQRLQSVFEAELSVAETVFAPEEARVVVRHKLHHTLEKVTVDVLALKFNTAIASLMELLNQWESTRRAVNSAAVFALEELSLVVRMIAPLAPFLAEELWHQLPDSIKAGHYRAGVAPVSVHLATWPTFDIELAKPTSVVIPVQINGKVRAKLTVGQELLREHTVIVAEALSHPGVQKHLAGKKIKKQLYIAGKIVSIVVEQ